MTFHEKDTSIPVNYKIVNDTEKHVVGGFDSESRQSKNLFQSMYSVQCRPTKARCTVSTCYNSLSFLSTCRLQFHSQTRTVQCTHNNESDFTP